MAFLLTTGGEVFSLCDISEYAYSEDSEIDEATEDAEAEYYLNETIKAGDRKIPRGFHLLFESFSFIFANRQGFGSVRV